MRILRGSGGGAAEWIAALEPWCSLGYRPGPLGRWLARMGRAGRVRVAVEGREVRGLVVVHPDVLLGDFIALLAVRPDAAGRGIGRALVEDTVRRSRRGWLYTSSDARNAAAAAFYRKVGFTRVGRLPDLVRRGRVELLWRRALTPPRPGGGARRAGGAGGGGRRSP